MAYSRKKKKISKKVISPKKTKDLPATIGMFDEFRKEIKSEFASQTQKFISLDKKIDSVKHEVKSEIHEVKSEVSSLKSEIHDLKSIVEKGQSEIHRTLTLVEQQVAQNKFVLDGFTMLHQRVEDVEQRQIKDSAELRSLIKSSQPK